MIEYKMVKFKDVYKELTLMFKENWDMVGHKGGFDVFSLDIPKFIYLEEKGLLAASVAVKDGNIIGYGNFLIDSISHNSNKISAYVDAIFVSNKYRNSVAGVGHKLIKFSEKELNKRFGVGTIQFGVNCNYDISKFLEKIGYIKTEIIYIKNIEGK